MLRSLEGRLTQVLSSGKAVILLSLFCLLCRSEYIVLNQDFNSDKQAQIISGQSALQGKGIRLPYADPTDLGHIEYQDYYQWPRGYSVYFAFTYFMVGNVFWTSVILDFIALLLYLLSWRLLISHFSDSGATRNFALSIFLIITSVSNVPFIYLKSSDFLSISFYMLSVCLLFYVQPGKRSWVYYGIGLISLCLALYTRYAYIPVAFSVCIGFLYLFYKTRKKDYLIRFTIAILTIGLVTVLTNHSVQAGAFETDTKKLGYHFEALAGFNYLFPLQTFLTGSAIYSMGKLFIEKHLIILVKVTSCVFILVVFGRSYFKILQGKFAASGNLMKITILISSLLASVVSISLLVYMSLTRPIQNNDILNNWTYVQEERYFTVVWVSILAAFLFIVLVDKGRLRRIILLIFYFSIFIDLPYYFYNKVIDIGKNSSYFLTGEKKIYFAQYPKNSRQRDSIMEGYERLRMIISELKTENGIRPVYISDDRSPRIAVLQGAVFGQMSSPNENLRTSRTQSIIIKVSDHDPYPNETLKEFVENNKKEPTYSGLIGNIYIYTIPSSLTSKGRSPGVSGK